MSEKSDNFRRLASKRTDSALKMIRSIGKLSNTGHYEYSDDDVNRIYGALRQELDEMKAKFSLNRPKRTEFQL
jgi:hypothetical protein